MKVFKTWAAWLCWISLLACQEENIRPEAIHCETFFVMTDNPEDSIQHRTYEIYETYGVPVFFNDTIGKLFVKTDIHGDSVYRYETLDLNWKFSSENYDIHYSHEYIADPKKKMEALDFVEQYLESVSAALYPFSILLTKVTEKPDLEGTSKMDYGIFFRTLLFSNLDKYRTPQKREQFIHKVRIKVILGRLDDKIIDKFSTVSDAKYYGKKCSDLESDLPDDFNIKILKDPAAPEEAKAKVREVIGKYGFVYGYEDFDFNDDFEMVYFYTTPSIPDQDLEHYIDEITSVSAEEFVRRWGSFPLVMEKYNLLRDDIPVKE